MYQRRGRGVMAALVVVSALLIPVVSSGAQTPADNTKVNKRDRAEGPSRPTSRKRTRAIGRSLRRSAAGSWPTKRFHLRAQREDRRSERPGHAQGTSPDGRRKKSVEAKATEVAGAGRVTNEITIAPTKGSKK